MEFRHVLRGAGERNKIARILCLLDSAQSRILRVFIRSVTKFKLGAGERNRTADAPLFRRTLYH